MSVATHQMKPKDILAITREELNNSLHFIANNRAFDGILGYSFV